MSKGNLLDAAASGIASPASLARVASRGLWQPARHFALLNYYALTAFAGLTPRLMIRMPPRHGKSEFMSHWLPAWWIGTRPSTRVILASYEAEFAKSWGRKVRDTLEDVGPTMFGVHVRKDDRAANRWGVVGMPGGMITAGVGGGVTGRGGELLLTDDLIKNDQQANSAAERQKAWNWYRATFRTRLQPGGAEIHTGTRWHFDDIQSRIESNGIEIDEPWTIVDLPAIAREAESYPMGWHREKGDALWPEQYNAAALDQIKKTIGSHWWSALYDQQPQKISGGIFKRQWFRYWSGKQPGGYTLLKPDGTTELVAIANCQRFMTVDPAASTKDSADYFVIAVWAVTPNRELILLDIVRDRLEGPDQPALIRSMFDRWKVAQIKVESVAYQLTLFQALLRMGLPVTQLQADKDKISRALVLRALLESGRVYFPQHAPWLGEYEAELLEFDKATHDDQVDASSYAAIAVSGDILNVGLPQLSSR